MKHVAMLSSGVTSTVMAKRLAEKFGTENLTLLFADVNGEDEDNYRFLLESARWIGGQLVILTNDGRTIWDVFEKTRFLGNSRIDPCSRVLKREAMREWLEANHPDPNKVFIHIGFDYLEMNRADRARPLHKPYRVMFPLMWDPMLDKADCIEMLKNAGIEVPALTREGFPHANCGGACVKAGQKQFRKLLDVRPSVYAEWEREEEKMRAHLDKNVAILRDRSGGTSTPLTLREFRHRITGGGEDDGEWGSCHCLD